MPLDQHNRQTGIDLAMVGRWRVVFAGVQDCRHVLSLAEDFISKSPDQALSEGNKMNMIKTALLAVVLAGTSSVAYAQDAAAGHDMTAKAGDASMGAELPSICTSSKGLAGDMSMGTTHQMDQAHTDLMAGMDVTNKQMMDAMMVEDIDVAFVCGMIPHHQGAINMAKAELEHGDNQWAKDMAQKVIDAQEQEIADMVAWLEAEGAKE
jgi:hypothetical protein